MEKNDRHICDFQQRACHMWWCGVDIALKIPIWITGMMMRNTKLLMEIVTDRMSDAEKKKYDAEKIAYEKVRKARCEKTTDEKARYTEAKKTKKRQRIAEALINLPDREESTREKEEEMEEHEKDKLFFWFFFSNIGLVKGLESKWNPLPLQICVNLFQHKENRMREKIEDDEGNYYHDMWEWFIQDGDEDVSDEVELYWKSLDYGLHRTCVVCKNKI